MHGPTRSSAPLRGSTTRDNRPVPRLISTIGVVVPARNEQERLPGCLTALTKAVEVLQGADPTAPAVRIVVVIDRSTDRTQAIAEHWPGVETVLSDAGRVGAARRAGVAHLLHGAGCGAALHQLTGMGTDGANLAPSSFPLSGGTDGLGDASATQRPDPKRYFEGVPPGIDVGRSSLSHGIEFHVPDSRGVAGSGAAGAAGAVGGAGDDVGGTSAGTDAVSVMGSASCTLCRAILPSGGLHAVGGPATEHCRTVGSLWIACTDADSVVPEDWLVSQAGFARSGVDMVLGTVVPDPAELAAGLLAAWRLRHNAGDGHPHVHGANMGIRGDMYVAAGGFQDVPTHEDLMLSMAVRAAGGQILSSGANPVITSGRTEGRAPGGMAHYLQEIGSQRVPLEA